MNEKTVTLGELIDDQEVRDKAIVMECLYNLRVPTKIFFNDGKGSRNNTLLCEAAYSFTMVPNKGDLLLLTVNNVRYSLEVLLKEVADNHVINYIVGIRGQRKLNPKEEA